jgi:predicted O-methyltransferase YrrM
MILTRPWNRAGYRPVLPATLAPMPSTLSEPRVDEVLSRLYAQADRDDEVAASLPERRALPDRKARLSMTARERSEALQDVYMPVAPDVGRLLYALVRASRPETVVEFGTSFGISTIHLAAAVTDNGTGRVVTTELSDRKAAAARENLAEAGLAGVVTILAGDARETLADVTGPIGVVLLDGWKDLYLPVMQLLQPQLTPGALVIADDSSFESTADYLAYVRDPGNGFVTMECPVDDGVEVSSWTGR